MPVKKFFRRIIGTAHRFPIATNLSAPVSTGRGRIFFVGGWSGPSTDGAKKNWKRDLGAEQATITITKFVQVVLAIEDKKQMKSNGGIRRIRRGRRIGHH